MIHLETATQNNKHLILPTTANPINWDEPFPQHDNYPSLKQHSHTTTTRPRTPTDGADGPRTESASAPSSPASPADGNSVSPTRDERSSSLSPAPSPNTAAQQHQQNTTQTAASTPLSELSPPPDDFEADDPPTKSDAEQDASNETKPVSSTPTKADDHVPKASQQKAMSAAVATPPAAESMSTPAAAGSATSPVPGDPKVVLLLELNEELLKVCMEFQNRRMALAEPQFQAYSARLQSNLQWSASVVDNARGNQARDLPMMDAPPPLDFYPTDRIQELYTELPTVFAKEIARRAASSSSPLNPHNSAAALNPANPTNLAAGGNPANAMMGMGMSSPLKRERSSDDGMPGDMMSMMGMAGLLEATPAGSISRVCRRTCSICMASCRMRRTRSRSTWCATSRGSRSCRCRCSCRRCCRRSRRCSANAKQPVGPVGAGR
ncbi:hypothetical protein C8R45DRAFT_240970 [Mycena sanguinolenta]|nr:hypothetical protein C8R45DRAFT_240970 [Mycena sanguinolenta]